MTGTSVILLLMYRDSVFAWHVFCAKPFNTLRPRQDGCQLPDDIFKCIFLNENPYISIRISLKFVPKGPINNIPSLVQIMAWRRPGDKPISWPMCVNLLTHICVTRPQWVKLSKFVFGAVFDIKNLKMIETNPKEEHIQSLWVNKHM